MDLSTKVVKGIQDPQKAIRYLVTQKFGNTTDYFRSIEQTRYLLWLHQLYEEIDQVPGHIVEFGTGPGTNAVIFGHLMHLYGDDNIRHYYGFDTFEGYTEEGINSSPYLDEEAWQDLDISSVRSTLRYCNVDDVATLIKGDLKQTLPEFIDEEEHNRKAPENFHVALVYIDCNSYKAAKVGLEEIYEYVTPGGMICVDQLKQGGETRALREFCDERGLPFKKGTSPIAWAPYTVKPA